MNTMSVVDDTSDVHFDETSKWQTQTRRTDSLDKTLAA
jgi:hypothetical protein